MLVGVGKEELSLGQNYGEGMKELDAKSIEDFMGFMGYGVPHDPLVAVVRSDGMRGGAFEEHRVNYGFYALFLKNTKCCVINYGRTEYDYDEGAITSFAPGQTVTVSPVAGSRPSSVGLLFHPDLLHGTELEGRMREYGYFAYSSSEALHPSAEERAKVLDCLEAIEEEAGREHDRVSRRIIVGHIEVLLDYCLRFYERQFASRETLNRDAVSRFEVLLDRYFDEGRAESEGLPTVSYFADKICLTANYFGDMVKRQTGLNPKELINRKVVALAKSRIVEPRATVKGTAYSLGFQYPQHFVRFFKKETGLTPTEYANSVG